MKYLISGIASALLTTAALSSAHPADGVAYTISVPSAHSPTQ